MSMDAGRPAGCDTSEMLTIHRLLRRVFFDAPGRVRGVDAGNLRRTRVVADHVEEISAEQLRQEHCSKGMPDDLAQILALAGQADVRILILDADAPVLPGLPLAGE